VGTETFIKISAGAYGTTASILTRTNDNKTKLYTIDGASNAPAPGFTSAIPF